MEHLNMIFKPTLESGDENHLLKTPPSVPKKDGSSAEPLGIWPAFACQTLLISSRLICGHI